MIATVVGNYPKIAGRTDGQRLRQVLNQLDQGRATIEQVRQVEDEVTREVIDEQVRAGLDLVTDGQIRWDDGQTYFAQRLDGFVLTGLIRYFDTNTYYRQPIAKSQIRWKGPILLHDYEMATAHSPKPVKPVVTGPYTLAKLSLTEHHKTLRDFALNVADALRQEIESLQKAGAPLIQIDEPAIVRNKEDWPVFQETMQALTTGISAKLALCTYFGDATGLPGFFALPVQVFLLDFVQGQANFKLLSEFPKDRELGFGILDARNVKLEDVDYLVDNIKRASAHVSPERLHVHPAAGLEFLPREWAYAKLERIVEGVKRAQEVVA
ncbi:MAG: methylcobamide--CoM methyltransferase [Chloroflexi bacterium]|nr:methylcobamide--CoM methyltransferase [Chloroflexota bacterium]